MRANATVWSGGDVLTIDEALSAMTTIDKLNDGTVVRMLLVEELHQKLIEDPEGFWDFYLEATVRAIARAKGEPAYDQ
jgi:hypothetical protein